MYLKSKQMKLIRESLEAGTTLGVAIRSSGMKSTYTVSLWRKSRPMIDRYFNACIDKMSERRNDAVVDALFKAAKDGNIGAIAIWLKFKMGWKDSPLIDQSQHSKTFVYLDPKAKEDNSEKQNRITPELSSK